MDAGIPERSQESRWYFAANSHPHLAANVHRGKELSLKRVSLAEEASDNVSSLAWQVFNVLFRR